MTAPASLATLPVVRALLDEARRKQYATGTLGIHARPQWPGSDTFEHQGVPVTVVPCGSTLAVREALRQRRDDRWLVILTDRDDTDLGAGVRSHLLWHRLRTPDPWAAVLGRFAATGLDPALTTGSGRRDLAVGLLACTPAEGGWVPAPGGVLTRDHALGSVARRYLRLPMAELDPGAVLAWTAQPDTASLVADLRGLSGHPVQHRVGEPVTGQAAQVRDQARRVRLRRPGQHRAGVQLGHGQLQIALRDRAQGVVPGEHARSQAPRAGPDRRRTGSAPTAGGGGGAANRGPPDAAKRNTPLDSHSAAQAFRSPR